MWNGKIWPPPPLNSLTDRHQNLHRWLRLGCLRPCKIFYSERIRGYVAAHARLRAPNCLLGYCWVLNPAHSQDTIPWTLTQNTKIRQKTHVRARMCFFWVSKPNLTFTYYNLFSPKTAIFGPNFDGLENFRRKTALTLDVLRVNGP